MLPLNDESVARALVALGSGTRLAILRQLRTPLRLREIELAGERGTAGTIISRQAVREHLDKLLEAGFVARRDAAGDQRSPHVFVLNHQAIFALAEGIKGLARLRPLIEPSTPTAPIAAESAPAASGPRFVLVKGLEDGTIFPLPTRGVGDEAVIGRRRGLAVSLDFDPFVSSENAVVRWDGLHHYVRDVGPSLNGTSLNLARLGGGEERVLRHGDLVGVGNSLLLYWT